MSKKMLIDATHSEETRVVVVDGNKVEEFDFEKELTGLHFDKVLLLDVIGDLRWPERLLEKLCSLRACAGAPGSRDRASRRAARAP